MRWLVLYEYGTEYVITHRLYYPSTLSLDEVKVKARSHIDGCNGKTVYRVDYLHIVESEEYRNK